LHSPKARVAASRSGSEKSSLRSRLRRHRRDLAVALPGAAGRAADALDVARLPPFKIVAGYEKIGSEIDPSPVLRKLAAIGAALAFPVVLGPHVPLTFRTSRGDAIPDLIIAPLLAFDHNGARLGQGGGHYDRTIERLRARGPLFVIGLAYAGQEIEAVPFEPHDQRLDAILTEIGYIEFRKDI
jgi:5-formyltetrahydrofolate cyclo-ligase